MSWRSAGSTCACQLPGVCPARSSPGSDIGGHRLVAEQERGSGWCAGISAGTLSPVLQQLLCIFSLLFFTLFSLFLSDPSVSSQPVECTKPSSSMEGDCVVLSPPMAWDSREASLEPAAGTAGPPQHPAPPQQHTSGAEQPRGDKQDPEGCPLSQEQLPEAPECLIDSQPIPFSENPFVVANRRGKATGTAGLGGPPLGYGRGGVLKTSLYSKASGVLCVACTHTAWATAPY